MHLAYTIYFMELGSEEESHRFFLIWSHLNYFQNMDYGNDASYSGKNYLIIV